MFNQYAALNVADPVPADDITGVDSPDFELRVTYVTPEGIVTQGPLKVGNLISSSARARFSWVEGREETFYVGNGFIEDIRRGVKGIRPAPSAQ